MKLSEPWFFQAPAPIAAQMVHVLMQQSVVTLLRLEDQLEDVMLLVQQNRDCDRALPAPPCPPGCPALPGG